MAIDAIFHPIFVYKDLDTGECFSILGIYVYQKLFQSAAHRDLGRSQSSVFTSLTVAWAHPPPGAACAFVRLHKQEKSTRGHWFQTEHGMRHYPAPILFKRDNNDNAMIWLQCDFFFSCLLHLKLQCTWSGKGIITSA